MAQDAVGCGVPGRDVAQRAAAAQARAALRRAGLVRSMRCCGGGRLAGRVCRLQLGLLLCEGRHAQRREAAPVVLEAPPLAAGLLVVVCRALLPAGLLVAAGQGPEHWARDLAGPLAHDGPDRDVGLDAQAAGYGCWSSAGVKATFKPAILRAANNEEFSGNKESRASQQLSGSEKTKTRTRDRALLPDASGRR